MIISRNQLSNPWFRGTCPRINEHEADELEVAFEQLVNEIDHNCEYSQSTQEPDDSPEENND